MSTTSHALLAELHARALIAQTSHETELTQHLNTPPRTLYAGFDPSADSLHIGHLVPLLVLRRTQLAGHRPIALIGGATGLIGDPSFKANERQLINTDTITQNAQALQTQISQYLDFDPSPTAAQLINNLDWTQSLNTLTFLRDIGKHFSVNAMIQKESVKQRIEREDVGISYTEFSYMILQAYDFACLAKQHNCTIQIGGSDQWGNITAGIDLTRRLHQKTVYGITLPLITKADGTKFGKTESGTIWLAPHKTSPYTLYQFWLNTADADVYRFLHYFTFLPPTTITDIHHHDTQTNNKPEAQKILAQEATRFIHGTEGLQAAERITQALFTEQLTTLSSSDLAQLRLDGMPSTQLQTPTTTAVDLITQTGLAKSKTQAREFITQNAITLNGEKITDPQMPINRTHALHGQYLILKRGKKQFHLATWAEHPTP